MKYLPYIIAIACVILMSSNVLGQDKQRTRAWRVTYYDEYEQREVRSRSYSLSECVKQLTLIYQKERIQLYCTADKLKNE